MSQRGRADLGVRAVTVRIGSRHRDQRPVRSNVDDGRPATRGECLDGYRPCPFVGCRYHLYLEVNPDTGSIKFNRPDVAIENMVESCSLDVADRGPLSLEAVGMLTNLTRERTRQIEARALIALIRPAGAL